MHLLWCIISSNIGETLAAKSKAQPYSWAWLTTPPPRTKKTARQPKPKKEGRKSHHFLPSIAKSFPAIWILKTTAINFMKDQMIVKTKMKQSLQRVSLFTSHCMVGKPTATRVLNNQSDKSLLLCFSTVISNLLNYRYLYSISDAKVTEENEL